MYNKELFQKVVNCCGMTGAKTVTNEGIEEAQEQLGVRFPMDYISFIKEYGEAGIPGHTFWESMVIIIQLLRIQNGLGNSATFLRNML